MLALGIDYRLQDPHEICKGLLSRYTASFILYQRTRNTLCMETRLWAPMLLYGYMTLPGPSVPGTSSTGCTLPISVVQKLTVQEVS